MIILIAGASHTGKTALAQRLLEKYHYPYLSIDHLKMGLIRSGYTELTPSDDDALTPYLWPVVREMVKTAIEVEGPMYIRLSRDAAPDCHPEGAQFEMGKGMVVREGTDVTIIACGLMVSTAVTAAEALAAKGISAGVVDMYCIKPIDAELIETCAKETGAVVTAEEHSVIGGLGGAVAEVLAKAGCAVPTEMVGMQDCHGESGPYAALLKKYGLDADAVAAAAERAVSRK